MHRREFKMKVLTVVGIAMFMLALGTVLFSWVEKWSWIDSLYFVVSTATTIGYGDLTPTHDLSKILTVIYAISIVPLFLYAFSMIARYQVHHVYKKVHNIEIKQREQKKVLEKTAQQINSQKLKLKETEEGLEQQEKIIQEHDEELESFEKVIKKEKKVASK